MKAQTNWEKKSRFLLAEIVKYDSYVESLKAAMSLRLKKRGEKGPSCLTSNLPLLTAGQQLLTAHFEEPVQQVLPPMTLVPHGKPRAPSKNQRRIGLQQLDHTIDALLRIDSLSLQCAFRSHFTFYCCLYLPWI